MKNKQISFMKTVTARISKIAKERVSNTETVKELKNENPRKRRLESKKKNLRRKKEK